MTDTSSSPDLNSLVELSNREGLDIRPTLLRVITDLYLQKPTHTEQEDQHYTTLALRLIEHVDANTRALVAAKIVAYPNAPAAVRQRLLKDHIAVAPNAAPEPICRPKAAPQELNELFFASNADERRLILDNLSFAPIAPVSPIEADVARQSIRRLESAALAHHFESFARELERALSISRTQARRLANDPSGEPIVIAASALSMPAAVLQRILLCLNPEISQSVQRVYDLAQLHEELSATSALQMLAIWQAASRAENRLVGARPKLVSHEPQLASETPVRAASPPARPKIRWEEHVLARTADGS